jgi:CDP-2,3-bis-(O-geranylgeranyl)-sn-glycerol synthase|tara:strand:- start:4917 stop:5501 length:585 start_codon:yes stop_codon:yes gene_type:complete
MDLTEHSFLQVFFIVLWIMMPAYLSNTFAVITGGKFPIDQGKIHSDGNRILGDGKTWSGLIGGTSGGMLIGYLQLNYGNAIIDGIAGTNNYNFWGENELIIIFLLAFGALLGDMTASFFKRRTKLNRGDKSPVLDMFDFIGMALFLTLLFDYEWLKSWILDGYAPLFTLLIATPFLHRGVNIIGYKLGIKNEPW